MRPQKILVLDFGGQYDQLIARRVRDLHVYAEIKEYDKITPKEIKSEGYRGIIFTGGPNSVYDENSPHYDVSVLRLGIPVLGICYGAQLIAYMEGGTVGNAGGSGEYGEISLRVDSDLLFEGVPCESRCFMSHRDSIMTVPEGFAITATTPKCPVAAMSHKDRAIYAVQFHPEVEHTEYGDQVLSNFLFKVCGLDGDWKMDDFVESAIDRCRQELAGRTVLLGLSGGVDSSVTAALLSKAIGKDLTMVFVDHGMLRKNEGDLVEKIFGSMFGSRFIRVNAEDRFLEKLKGVTEPERKRKIIGEEFVRVFEAIAETLGEPDLLAQGTIYPDIVESGKGGSATIKSHHNVGGLPDVIEFKGIIEPLKELFKDEVREVGRRLGLPEELVSRQPFPGPGLGVRVIGEITKDKLNTLREADSIFREEVDRLPKEKRPDQYFAVLTNTLSVGVKGDGRAYGLTVALRAVYTDDFMTAEWSRLPYETVAVAASRIANEIPEVTRVVYDVTSKPPATVEWE
ncbi:MAG: glutamine-hydrolyzing GMP synthase [Clostridia bacterium]|nr:glutamine-hydrolyzing GMP synthase [Clostridia bacterium]